MTAFLLAWLALVPAPRQALVDEIVAVVNRHVITRSEVWEEAVLVLVERRGQAGLQHAVTPEFLKKVLSMLINQRILLDEARRVGLPQVTEAEREQLLVGFQRRFADREAYVRFMLEHGISEQAIGEALVRHYRIERLKAKKLRVMPEISDDRVRRYYDTHRRDFGGATQEAVAPAIRHRLGEQMRERELGRWLLELGKRSEVKVLVDMEADEASGG